jgi:hypothetical protein
VNDTYIWFKGAENSDGLYGEDVYAAVIDEGSRTREESWHAVRSTLTATRGPIRIIGNVKGRKNWFYNLARKAESGEPGMTYAKVTAWDAVKAGILDEGEIKDAQRQLPEHVFKELYLAEASEDGSNPFGMEFITACIAPLSDHPADRWGIDLAKSPTGRCCMASMRAVTPPPSIDSSARGKTRLPWCRTRSRATPTLTARAWATRS